MNFLFMKEGELIVSGLFLGIVIGVFIGGVFCCMMYLWEKKQ